MVGKGRWNMRVRLSGAFTQRWYEEWDLAHKQIAGSPASGLYVFEETEGESHRSLELFIEQFGGEIARVLKHQLLDELLRETAAREAVENVNKSKLNLDTASAL
jgi:hypothetical protein